MKRTKEGGLHFETLAEVINFKDKEMNIDKIRARARGRERIINYENPRTKYKVIHAGIRSLDKRKHREGMMLLETINNCAIEHDRLMGVMKNTNDPSAKYYIREQIKSIDRDEVYKHYMREWGYSIEKVKMIEKVTLDAIGDKIEQGRSMQSFGETIIQKAI